MCVRVPSPQSCAVNTAIELPAAVSERPADERPPEFHRLARASASHRWWRPPAAGVAATLLYLVLVLALFCVMAIAGLFFPGAWEATERFIEDPVTDFGEPGAYGLGMIAVALMLPAILAATRVLGVKPVGLVSSVAGRIRWGWLLRCSMVAGALYGVTLLGVAALMAVRGDSLAPRFESPHTLALVGLALLLVPFQAAAEEYVFRGYLMQAVGTWLRHPAFAVTLPVPLFVLAHGYELNGMVDIAAFALVAGWLTWRTGGLEAAIALHVVNNVVWSVLGAFGLVDLNATDSSTTDLVVSLLLTLAFAAAVFRAADRMGIERTRGLTS